MKTAETLMAAADLIQFGGHTRGTYAVNAGGVAVGAGSPEAVAWCAKGAIRAIALRHRRCQVVHASRALDEYFPRVTGVGIMFYNDDAAHSASDVADHMRRCAKALENGEGSAAS